MTMTTDETRALVEAYYEAMPKGRKAIRPFLADDCHWEPPASAPFDAITGGDEIAQALGADVVKTMFDVSKPFAIERQAMVVEGGTAVVRQHMEATAHNGNAYANDYCWIYECDGGKIVKMIEYADTLVASRVMGWS